MDREEILVITIVLLSVIGVALLCYVAFVYGIVGISEGTHTGYVTAVETNTDLFWTTKLVYFKTDTQQSQEDVYCVVDKDLYDELTELGKTTEHVTIHYQNDFWVPRSECNGGVSIIRSVE